MIEGATRACRGQRVCPRRGSSIFGRTGDEIEVDLGSLDASEPPMPTYELRTIRRESWPPPFPLARRCEPNRAAGSRFEE